MTKLVSRDVHLKRALSFRDIDLIKVITGVRRCGKSCLLELIRRKIVSEKVAGRNFVDINLESKTHKIKNEADLYKFVKSKIANVGKSYVFIDEPQLLKDWQLAVNALRLDFDCDIYITGSNAFLLSSELATLLSGRYVEIKMQPLVFKEYLTFCNLASEDDSSILKDENDKLYHVDDVFLNYLKMGGFPAIASLDITQEKHSAYMSSVYDTVVVKDILNRKRDVGLSKVTDDLLLSRLAEFMADNIGNQMSNKKISDLLSSSGTKTTNKTIESYVKALHESFIFYPANRFDLHGKEILKTNPKHYICDLGLRSKLCGYKFTNIGRMFENAVYLQLLYSGWEVHVGKLYNKEIDFVAIKDGRTVYIQVTDEMYANETREREIKPLMSIRNAYEKFIIVRQGTYEHDVEGIRILTARDFFLNNKF